MSMLPNVPRWSGRPVVDVKREKAKGNNNQESIDGLGENDPVLQLRNYEPRNWLFKKCSLASTWL